MTSDNAIMLVKKRIKVLSKIKKSKDKYLCKIEDKHPVARFDNYEAIYRIFTNQGVSYYTYKKYLRARKIHDSAEKYIFELEHNCRPNIKGRHDTRFCDIDEYEDFRKINKKKYIRAIRGKFVNLIIGRNFLIINMMPIKKLKAIKLEKDEFFVK